MSNDGGLVAVVSLILVPIVITIVTLFNVPFVKNCIFAEHN